MSATTAICSWNDYFSLSRLSFQVPGFAPSGDTVVCVAPVDCFIAVYGNGGVVGEGGLSFAFGGAAVFKNDASKGILRRCMGSPKRLTFSQ